LHTTVHTKMKGEYPVIREHETEAIRGRFLSLLRRRIETLSER
jgi:hypothetical protein